MNFALTSQHIYSLIAILQLFYITKAILYPVYNTLIILWCAYNSLWAVVKAVLCPNGFTNVIWLNRDFPNYLMGAIATCAILVSWGSLLRLFYWLLWCRPAGRYQVMSLSRKLGAVLAYNIQVSRITKSICKTCLSLSSLPSLFFTWSSISQNPVERKVHFKPDRMPFIESSGHTSGEKKVTK